MQSKQIEDGMQGGRDRGRCECECKSRSETACEREQFRLQEEEAEAAEAEEAEDRNWTAVFWSNFRTRPVMFLCECIAYSTRHMFKLQKSRSFSLSVLAQACQSVSFSTINLFQHARPEEARRMSHVGRSFQRQEACPLAGCEYNERPSA